MGHAHVALNGRADDGSWLTAPAKTYPQRMCEVIAGTIHDRASEVLAHHAGIPPEAAMPELELLALSMPVDWYCPDAWEARAHDCAA